MFGRKDKQLRQTVDLLTQSSQAMRRAVKGYEEATKLAQEIAEQRDRWQRLHEQVVAPKPESPTVRGALTFPAAPSTDLLLSHLHSARFPTVTPPTTKDGEGGMHK